MIDPARASPARAKVLHVSGMSGKHPDSCIQDVQVELYDCATYVLGARGSKRFFEV